MLKLIAEQARDIVDESGSVRLLLPEHEDFSKYLSAKKTALSNYRQEALAILDDRNLFTNYDVILTENGVLCIIKDTLQEICSYEAAGFESGTRELRIGTKRYGNKHVNTEALYQLFLALNRIIVED